MQLFGIPDGEFIGKEAENKNKNKREGEEEKRKGDKDNGGKNSGGGMNREKKMRGVIDRSASKGDN